MGEPMLADETPLAELATLTDSQRDLFDRAVEQARADGRAGGLRDAPLVNWRSSAPRQWPKWRQVMRVLLGTSPLTLWVGFGLVARIFHVGLSDVVLGLLVLVILGAIALLLFFVLLDAVGWAFGGRPDGPVSRRLAAWFPADESVEVPDG